MSTNVFWHYEHSYFRACDWEMNIVKKMRINPYKINV